MATAVPFGFPQETAENQAARNAFIREYNRLAKLAADAPDIHIYMSGNRIDNPTHHHVQNPAPVVHNPVPAFNKFGFTANLGHNQQFVPQAHTFPAPATHHLAGHLAGHQAGHVTHVAQPHAGPIFKWNGPFADTVPAGVNGLPRQVMDTPAVKAAKAAHFAALNAAAARAPAVHGHF